MTRDDRIVGLRRLVQGPDATGGIALTVTTRRGG